MRAKNSLSSNMECFMSKIEKNIGEVGRVRITSENSRSNSYSKKENVKEFSNSFSFLILMSIVKNICAIKQPSWAKSRIC